MVRGKRTTYENFVVDCPACGKEIVFNRASDLGTLEPVADLRVSCLDRACGKPFCITGDSVNEAYEMLVFDSYELRDRKHYMGCILNLAQAYETFFSLFLRVELLYKPFGAGSERNLDNLNRIADDLYKKTKKLAFAHMRRLFLQHVVTHPSPMSAAKAAIVVAALPGSPCDPKDVEIDALGDPNIVPLLIAIKKATINTLRNRVVHHRGYRPTRLEVEEALEETTSILFPLGQHLDLHDEINWYSREK